MYAQTVRQLDGVHACKSYVRRQGRAATLPVPSVVLMQRTMSSIVQPPSSTATMYRVAGPVASTLPTILASQRISTGQNRLIECLGGKVIIFNEGGWGG